ncbi:putative F-box domain, FBD domain, leucine-rich repeat domain superfamily [Helianthus annuus]|nr:putative F-box domain, FBD domain, leucine-rich repeat domain superfamily [Helianthus annuus]KAJ0462187.1 putative F-box domain, FBD domain, leucine-rich repeat domain superfamily [Helianthus annuus]KAJ0642564.1 putative F-box domain, FBD domain, leucine-rich repeat domain superfamily [Helianthus annuus]KAJ0646445.1 putative F-box domain, FBD domain, leucine-rich repeat domain superfamily [Helianthus annuus]KAJ0823131.1 putative F-box domain, FBD domain, leucine-rich repeat domain superfamil
MELIHGTQASNFAPQDFISNMPDKVVTNILDRLPLPHAMRTSVLSRKWRFKWTMLSQLVFYDSYFWNLRKDENRLRVISRLLLHLRGPITKFVLYIDDGLNVEDLNHWTMFLSRKGIKDLTIGKRNKPLVKLPTHLFTCLELKHLKLSNWCIQLPTTFNGFPNLLSLELLQVNFESGKFEEFITLCPVLEILKMSDLRSKVKPDDFAKLANLKTLSLTTTPFSDIDEPITITSSSAIFELLGFLPKLQELQLSFPRCKFTEGGSKKRFPDAFPCLKSLILYDVDVDSVIMVSCVFELIRHLPNLQTLIILACDQKKNCSPEVDYNTMGPLQLRSVMFNCLKGSENEVRLIKYLLACSPFLKKIEIYFQNSIKRHEQSMFATKLLKIQRAYPEVDISLY